MTRPSEYEFNIKIYKINNQIKIGFDNTFNINQELFNDVKQIVLSSFVFDTIKQFVKQKFKNNDKRDDFRIVHVPIGKLIINFKFRF